MAKLLDRRRSRASVHSQPVRKAVSLTGGGGGSAGGGGCRYLAAAAAAAAKVVTEYESAVKRPHVERAQVSPTDGAGVELEPEAGGMKVMKATWQPCCVNVSLARVSEQPRSVPRRSSEGPVQVMACGDTTSHQA